MLISDENKSHYVYIKDYISIDLCTIKQKIRIRNIFANVVYSVLEKVFIEHKENCLIMNGKQSVKLKSVSISFKKYLKLLHILLKIYAHFESILKGVKSSDNGSYIEKYQDHIRCSFAYKVVCIDNKFSKKVVLYREKNVVYRFIKAILEEYNCCKKMKKKNVLIRILLCLQKKKDFN